MYAQLVDGCDALSFVILPIFRFQLVLASNAEGEVWVFLAYLWEETGQVLVIALRANR